MRKLRNDTPAAEMTARELIAVKAMEGLLAANDGYATSTEYLATTACEIADQMINALNESAGVK